MADDEATDMTETSSLPAAKPVLALRSGFNTALRQLLALIGLFMIALSIPIGIMTPLIPIGLPFGILGVIAGWKACSCVIHRSNGLPRTG